MNRPASGLPTDPHLADLIELRELANDVHAGPRLVQRLQEMIAQRERELDWRRRCDVAYAAAWFEAEQRRVAAGVPARQE